MSICKNILCNITSNITRKATDKAVVAIPPRIEAMQASVNKAFSKNLAELEKFAQTELPQTIKDHKVALEGLEQLSKNIKSVI